jgi:hypothetical protein
MLPLYLIVIVPEVNIKVGLDNAIILFNGTETI